jgi:septum formation protein
MVNQSEQNGIMDIVLASSSPRRIELMRWAGFHFTTCIPDVDETPRSGEEGKVLVKRLATEKTLVIANRYPQKTILGADTIVMIDKKILGKPADENEAVDMIKMLSGKTHQVLTGVCIKGPNRLVIDVVHTFVTLRKLSEKQIKHYVDYGESLDKAGAYGIQGIGMVLVERIEGSFTNVVGLPMEYICAKFFDWE